jgi:hypothetical protein
MSQRRGEGQFVAVEVGLRHDPKVLGLAKRLRIHPQHAVGIVATWREMVLTRGTGIGVVRGYSRSELAAFVDWPGEPGRVIDALKGAGMLVMRRQAFVHPSWSETTTGSYAHHKSGERERKATERALRREWEAMHPAEPWPGLERARELIGQSADSPRTEGGPSASGSRTNGHKGSNGVRRTPQGAPRGGASDGATRLAEFESAWPLGVPGTEKCRAYLAERTPEEWAHILYAVREQSLSSRWKHTPWRVPPPLRWLNREEWKKTKWKPGQVKPDKKGSSPPPEPKPTQEEVDALKSKWERRAAIKESLRASGLRGADLESAIDSEMEKEQRAPS